MRKEMEGGRGREGKKEGREKKRRGRGNREGGRNEEERWVGKMKGREDRNDGR